MQRGVKRRSKNREKLEVFRCVASERVFLLLFLLQACVYGTGCGVFVIAFHVLFFIMLFWKIKQNKLTAFERFRLALAPSA